MDNKEYAKILNLLKKDEEIYVGFVKLVPPTNDSQIKKVYDCSRSFKNHDIVQELIEPSVIKRIDSVLNKKRRYGLHGKELPKLLKKYGDLVPPGARKKVVKQICGPMKAFYPYAKKDLIAVGAPWIQTEDEALKVVQNHHRILDLESLERLLSLITNGIDHDSLKEVRKKSLPFVARRLNTLDLNDPDQRHEIINNVAKTPSLLNHLNMFIEIKLEDIKKLPPARRFDFLQLYFKPVMGEYHEYEHNWWPRNITKARLKRAERDKIYQKLHIEKLKYKDIEHLLFAVSIRKNERVKEWCSRYKKYLEKADHFNVSV